MHAIMDPKVILFNAKMYIEVDAHEEVRPGALYEDPLGEQYEITDSTCYGKCPRDIKNRPNFCRFYNPM